MGVTASLFATCLFMAAQNYSVPPAVLIGILEVEGGRVGQEVRNTNGTSDLGPMQINTLWLDDLSRHWGMTKSSARKWVRDDACVNVSVAAWILRQKIEQTGSLYQGIAYYHSGTPHLGRKYRAKVLAAMERLGLLQPHDNELTALVRSGGRG